MGDEIDKTLARAMIVEDGVLQKPHSWLEKNVRSWKKASPAAAAQKKRVLLLGSGLVAGPAVDVFLARPDVALVIGELLLSSLSTDSQRATMPPRLLRWRVTART